MGRSGRRRLSPEERDLWEKVAASAVPLHPRSPSQIVTPENEPMPTPLAPMRKSGSEAPFPIPPLARRSIPEPQIRLDLTPDPRFALGVGAPRMDRRRFDKLRRGRLEPEDRLDLHGMTAGRAHSALTGFILGSYTRNLRLVLVITGKGRSDEFAMTPHRTGVLRHGVPHWLSTPPLSECVLDIVPAHQRHGGGGAYYVYLSRRR